MRPQQNQTAACWSVGMPPLSMLGQDLLLVTLVQRCHALVLPLASAAMLGLCVGLGWLVAAPLAAAVYTFYSYGSTSHDLVHRNLGLPRWLNHILLSIIELAGLRSGHAYQAAHLQHHARFPQADDIEGAPAHGTLIGAVLAGPLQQLRIWCWAVRHARRHRAWIVAEGLVCLAIALVALAYWPVTHAPSTYVALVVLGSWAFPLFTGYLPHYPQGANHLSQTRRFRGIVAAVLFRQHLYHLEHHLYPAVPHQHWPQLAARLDPHFDRAGVPPIVLGF
jgi:beta-carotene hydroxylase